jgi:hypothetical protein
LYRFSVLRDGGAFGMVAATEKQGGAGGTEHDRQCSPLADLECAGQNGRYRINAMASPSCPGSEGE